MVKEHLFFMTTGIYYRKIPFKVRLIFNKQQNYQIGMIVNIPHAMTLEYNNHIEVWKLSYIEIFPQWFSTCNKNL